MFDGLVISKQSPPPAVDKFNLSRAEYAATRMAAKLASGEAFVCVRYRGQVEADDCINLRRGPLCRECSTGELVRRRNGISLPFSLKEDFVPKKQKKKTILCPGCGRNMPHHGRGHCGRCYPFVKDGKPIPPLNPEPAPTEPVNDITPEVIHDQLYRWGEVPRKPASRKRRSADTKNAEGAWVLADIGQARVLEGDAANDLRMQLDLEGLLGADEVMEWLDTMAAVELRTIDAQALYVLRGVMDKESRP